MPKAVHYRDLVPDAVSALEDLESVIDASSLDESLVEFVKLRASQINGCAYCVDVHTRRARQLGVDERRIAAVAAWQESPFFDDRERAALQLTERITRLSEAALEEAVLDPARDQFDKETLAVLTMAINAINCWNRLWVTFRTPEIPELAN